MSLGLHSRLHFDHSIKRTLSPLFESSNRSHFPLFRFSDEDSGLAEKVFYGDFSELPKRSPPKAQALSKGPSESSKINKKNTLNAIFLQNKKQLQDLLYEINPDLSISKSTFYPFGNIKILPKTTSYYLVINNLAFSNAIYRITKK